MTAGERYLVIRLAGHEYAVPAHRICGMLQMRGLDLHRVEGGGALRYTTSFHGRRLPVYSPNQALGLKERDISARTCLLLIREDDEEEEEADAAFALAVDSISRIEELPPAQVRANLGQVRLGDKWRAVLDPEAVRAA